MDLYGMFIQYKQVKSYKQAGRQVRIVKVPQFCLHVFQVCTNERPIFTVHGFHGSYMIVQIESHSVLTVPRLNLHQDHLLAGLIVAGYDDKKGGQAQSETPFWL